MPIRRRPAGLERVAGLTVAIIGYGGIGKALSNQAVSSVSIMWTYAGVIHAMNDAACTQPPGQFIPLVDFSRCEAKGPCADVCPYDVFEIRKIDKSDFDKLGFLSKVKNLVHGGKVSYTPNANQCQACGLCVKACPEQAIKLVRADR